MKFVTYEDRVESLVGIQLLALSLRAHSPAAMLAVTCPDPPAAFVTWIRSQPNAYLHDPPALVASGWDVKPALLLDHLRSGTSEVTWIDADVIATGDVERRLREEPAESVISTEDLWWGRHQGDEARTLAWGLQPGRTPPKTVNTALVCVRSRHIPLLEAWEGMLRSEAYRSAQGRPIAQRSIYMMGDQEAFTALLGAREWADVDLRYLRRGIDIAQCMSPVSFSPAERLRLRARKRMPVLVHAMGRKPWQPPETAGWAASTVASAHRSLSPYVWAASAYLAELPPVSWPDAPSPLAQLSAAVTRRDPLLQELPVAILDAFLLLRMLALGKLGSTVARFRNR